MPVQSAKASVELTKNDDGTMLNVEIGGRKAAISLTNNSHGPIVSGILADWAESHFLGKPAESPNGVTTPGRLPRTLTMAWECLLTGTMTLVLIAIIGGVLWLCYVHAGSMAEGLGMAVGAGLLGGVVRYFRNTRRALHHLSGGLLPK